MLRFIPLFTISISLFILLVNFSDPADSVNCTTITKASGLRLPKYVCAGDLIFQDEFEDLDQSVWQHENTLRGGGVSTVHNNMGR